jgi:hypothetical protein
VDFFNGADDLSFAFELAVDLTAFLDSIGALPPATDSYSYGDTLIRISQ